MKKKLLAFLAGVIALFGVGFISSNSSPAHATDFPDDVPIFNYLHTICGGSPCIPSWELSGAAHSGSYPLGGWMNDACKFVTVYGTYVWGEMFVRIDYGSGYQYNGPRYIPIQNVGMNPSYIPNC